MSYNRRSLPGTIVVAFDEKTADEAVVQDLLKKNGVVGKRVSTFFMRYAVDVPAGKEEKFVTLFSQNALVKHVYSNCLKGSQSQVMKRKAS